MTPSHRFTLFCLLPALAVAAGTIGCADPTEGKPEAVVQEASKPGTRPAGMENAPGERYVITAENSKISFVGSKVTGSHDGGFNSLGGQITVQDNDPAKSTIHVTIDTTSLWSDNERLTEHLKSPDFFDVQTYPRATFVSTAIERNGDQYTVSGDLDLHGVKKNISFPAEIEVGDGKISAKSEFSLKRFDFGIVYPGKPDDLIRDGVLVKLELSASRGGGRTMTQ